MGRLRIALRWLRVEDEQGQLSLTTLAFAVGIYCLVRGSPVPLGDLAAFGLALGAYAHKRQRQHRQVELAMDGAQEAAMQREQQKHELEKAGQVEHVRELGARVEHLVDKVLEVTSPERLQGLKDAFRRKSA